MAKVPGAGKPNPQNPVALTPQNPVMPDVPEEGRLNTNQGHRISDVDSSKLAQHHTLGIGPNQAAPGNHTHNGIDSKLISQFSDPDSIIKWNPGWLATVTQPTIGNGICDGYYARLGMWCFFTIRLLMGTTTTYGSGGYFFTVPFFCIPGPFFAISGQIQNADQQWPAVGWIERTAANLFYITPASAKTEGMATQSVQATGWKTAWGQGDFMLFSGWFWIDLNEHPL